MVDEHLEVLEETNAAEAAYEEITFGDFEAVFTDTRKSVINIKGVKREVEFVLSDNAFNLMLGEDIEDKPLVVRGYEERLLAADDEELGSIVDDFSEEDLDEIAAYTESVNDKILVKAFISPNIVYDDDWDKKDKTQVPLSRIPKYVKEALIAKYNEFNNPAPEEEAVEKRFQANGTGE